MKGRINSVSWSAWFQSALFHACHELKTIVKKVKHTVRTDVLHLSSSSRSQLQSLRWHLWSSIINTKIIIFLKAIDFYFENIAPACRKVRQCRECLLICAVHSVCRASCSVCVKCQGIVSLDRINLDKQLLSRLSVKC